MTRTAREDPPAKLTEATINLKIGGQWRGEWEETVGALAGVGPSGHLGTMRKATHALGRESEKVGDIPPEHRSLRLESLVKMARTALSGIDRNESEAVTKLDKVISGYADAVDRQLGRLTDRSANASLAAQGIRDRVARAEHPMMEARKLLDDPEGLRAVLSVSPSASGLSPGEHGRLRDEATARHLPHVHQERAVVMKAREEITRSAGQARTMIAEASGLEHRDGTWKAAWEID